MQVIQIILSGDRQELVAFAELGVIGLHEIRQDRKPPGSTETLETQAEKLAWKFVEKCLNETPVGRRVRGHAYGDWQIIGFGELPKVDNQWVALTHPFDNQGEDRGDNL